MKIVYCYKVLINYFYTHKGYTIIFYRDSMNIISYVLRDKQ